MSDDKALSPRSDTQRRPPADFVNQYEEFINEVDKEDSPGSQLEEQRNSKTANPAVHFKESVSEFLIIIDWPELGQKEFRVDLVGNSLTISEDRRQVKQRESSEQKRLSGQSQKSFLLPVQVEPEKINAHFTDGVLFISLPKAKGTRDLSGQIH